MGKMTLTYIYYIGCPDVPVSGNKEHYPFFPILDPSPFGKMLMNVDPRFKILTQLIST